MKQNLHVLNDVQIAKPCPANWDEMKGDATVRHCTHCRLNVYNLSEMTSEEALRTIQSAEGRLCVRLYRRSDGTMITRDCPKGLAAFRRQAVRRLAMAASLVLSTVGCGAVGERLTSCFLPSSEMGDVAAPTPAPAPATMGAVAMPSEKTEKPSQGGKASR